MGLRHDLLRAPCVLSLPEYTIGRSVTERELIYGKTSRNVIRTGFPNILWFALSVRHQLERKSAATLNHDGDACLTATHVIHLVRRATHDQ
jgi:hypothetical protein